MRARLALAGAVLALLCHCAQEVDAPASAGRPCERDRDCSGEVCGQVMACVRGRCQQPTAPGKGILVPCPDGGVVVVPDSGAPDAGFDTDR